MRYHLGNQLLSKGSGRNSLLGLEVGGVSRHPPSRSSELLAVKFKKQDGILLQICSSLRLTDRRGAGLATSHEGPGLFLADGLLLSLGNWAFEEASLTPFDSDDRQSAHFLTSKPLA